MEESNSNLPWYFKDKPRKVKRREAKIAEWRAVWPSAEEKARYEEQMQAYLNNPDGKVRPMPLRENPREYIKKVLEENKGVKEYLQKVAEKDKLVKEYLQKLAEEDKLVQEDKLVKEVAQLNVVDHN